MPTNSRSRFTQGEPARKSEVRSQKKEIDMAHNMIVRSFEDLEVYQLSGFRFPSWFAFGEPVTAYLLYNGSAS